MMKKRLLVAFLLAVALTAPVLGQCPGGTCRPQPSYRVPAQPSVPTPAVKALDASKYTSTIRVRSTLANGHGWGSGVVVLHGSRRVVLTAQHVVRGAKDVAIFTAGGVGVRTTVLAADPYWDVAVLDGANLPRTVASMAQAKQNAAVNDPVWTLGFGRGRLTGAYSVVTGHSAPKTGEPGDWLSLRGAVVSGDSGGPAINRSGQLVGIIWGGSGSRAVMTSIGRVQRVLSQVSRVSENGFICGSGSRATYPATPTPSAPIVSVPAAPAAPTKIEIDTSGITDALEKQADATTKLSDAASAYLNAQTQAMKDRQTNDRLAQVAPVVGDAVSGFQEGGLRGAAAELTDSGTSGILGSLTATLLCSVFGIGGIAAVAVRLGVPWAVRFGCRYLNDRLAAPSHTEADDVVESVANRVNKPFTE